MAISKAPYRGTRDFFPSDMRLRNYIFQKMAEVSEAFGYEPYDGPLLEEVELYLAKSGEELINEQIYSFTDRGERKVAIRPEMTPTVARMVAQVHREVSKPLRWYAIPNLMRYEKPQKGRLREFWQYNADIFGGGELGEVEMLQLAVAIMKSFGAGPDHFEILINDRRFVDAVFGQLLELEATAAARLYKVVDKVNKVSAEALAKMVQEILPESQKSEIFHAYLKLSSFVELKQFVETHNLGDISTGLLSFVGRVEAFGLHPYVKFDPSIVRGLDYYTSIVFEIFDKHPENRRAIAGGGSYANLLQIFNEPALPGVGFGMGEVPLTNFLEAHGLAPDCSKAEVDVLVSYLVANGEGAAFKLAEQLRDAGLRAEVFLGETKPKKVFAAAEKKNYRFVALFGESELSNGEVQLKKLATKEAQTISTTDAAAIIKLIKDTL
jgi:histidyl-tRNA synthetase